jgi:hypothetical protein
VLDRSAGVWDGRELLVAGEVASGEPATNAAAAYSPATGRWRRLPDPPRTDPGRYEGEIEAVWTGSEMIMLGASLRAAYAPATNRWRTLPDATVAHIGGFALVWTGRAVLTWGGGCCASFEATGTTYDPATNAWSALPAAPLSGRLTDGVWTGGELVIAGGATDVGALRDGAAYNPATRTWRSVASLPTPRSGAALVWDGHEVLLVGGQDGTSGALPTAAVAYDPATDRWRTLPGTVAGRVGHRAVWTGRQLLVWGGGRYTSDGFVAAPHGDAYTPATRRWSALPISPLRGRAAPIAVWTGHALLVWGGEGSTDGAAYTP